MKRIFYYLECENIPKLFSYLNNQVDEGFITYKIDDINGVIIINNIELDDDDELFSNLLKMDLIEDSDVDFDDYDDYSDGFDDFYNDDDV